MISFRTKAVAVRTERMEERILGEKIIEAE